MYITYGQVTDTNLQRKDDHCKAHNCCDAHRHDHGVCVMETGDHSHHVGHAESQDRLKTRNTQIHQHCCICLIGIQFKWHKLEMKMLYL